MGRKALAATKIIYSGRLCATTGAVSTFHEYDTGTSMLACGGCSGYFAELLASPTSNCGSVCAQSPTRLPKRAYWQCGG